MIDLLGTHLITINCIPSVADREEATKLFRTGKRKPLFKHFHLHFQWCRLKKGILPDPLLLPKRYSPVTEDHLAGFHGALEPHDEK